jgi:predicted nucleotidyltransferase
MQRLKSTALFTPDAGRNHRLRFHGFPVDVIPFGGIETEDGTIVWPDDTGTMNMAGFQDVYKHALCAGIGQGEKISVASLPGMAVLKIVAWDDRHTEFPTKDADDLALILRSYAEAGNSERLYAEHSDFVIDVVGDLELAGARLLGFDMAAIMSLSTKKVVQKILAHNTEPGGSDKLVEAILRCLPGRSYERALFLLQNLQKGIGGE